jgi:hypothetical protein
VAHLNSSFIRYSFHSGLRVLRDTAVITGEKAFARGRLLQVFAVICAIASVLMNLLLWRLASLIGLRGSDFEFFEIYRLL